MRRMKHYPSWFSGVLGPIRGELRVVGRPINHDPPDRDRLLGVGYPGAVLCDNPATVCLHFMGIRFPGASYIVLYNLGLGAQTSDR